MNGVGRDREWGGGMRGAGGDKPSDILRLLHKLSPFLPLPPLHPSTPYINPSLFCSDEKAIVMLTMMVFLERLKKIYIFTIRDRNICVKHIEISHYEEMK